MEKSFKKFIDLIYIEGFFESGFYNKKSFTAKPYFVLNLLKSAVENPDGIAYTQSSINGYIGGNAIDSVAKALVEAGFSAELLADYIASLYVIPHRDTKTFNERYGDKNYGEALLDRVSKEFKYITKNNMASLLAKEFNDIISATIEKSLATTNASDTSEDNIIQSYILSAEEKSSIKNVCSLIKQELRDMMRSADSICILQGELKKLDATESTELLRQHKEFSLTSLQKKYASQLSELERLCKALYSIIGNRKQLYKAMGQVADIAGSLPVDQYRITSPETFRFNSLTLFIDSFNKKIEKLLEILDTV